jgi:hypothetical protein
MGRDVMVENLAGSDLYDDEDVEGPQEEVLGSQRAARPGKEHEETALTSNRRVK